MLVCKQLQKTVELCPTGQFTLESEDFGAKKSLVEVIFFGRSDTNSAGGFLFLEV